MSNRARVAIVAVAAIGLVIAFFVASGSDDQDDPPVVVQTTSSGQTPEPAAPADGVPQEPTATTGTTLPEPEPELPIVRFSGGEVQGGLQRLEFASGDEVRFRVVSDVTEEVHVHGYDRYVDLAPGEPRTVSFVGELEGIFEIELHGSGEQLAELVVEPS